MASSFTLLKNPPSILTFTWCYGAVKHLFLRRFLVPGGAVRHAQYRGKYTSQQATTGQCADDKRLEEKYDGEGDGEHMQPMQSTCNEWCSASWPCAHCASPQACICMPRCVVDPTPCTRCCIDAVPMPRAPLRPRVRLRSAERASQRYL